MSKSNDLEGVPKLIRRQIEERNRYPNLVKLRGARWVSQVISNYGLYAVDIMEKLVQEVQRRGMDRS